MAVNIFSRMISSLVSSRDVKGSGMDFHFQITACINTEI